MRFGFGRGRSPAGLLTAGSYHLDLPGLAAPVSLSWRFSSDSRMPAGLSAVSVHLDGGGVSALGGGEGRTFIGASRRAFAEAWERWWFRRTAHISAANSTTGFAAGTSVEDASARAQDELIERRILTLSWNSKKGFTPYIPTRWFSRWLMARARQSAWDFRFYRIGVPDHAGVLCILGTHRELGAVFDSAALRDPGQTERKLALSLLRAIGSQQDLSPISDDELPESAGPESHARFYRNPANLRAFDFLECAVPAWEPGELDLNLEEIQTEVLFSGPDFPAVARAYQPAWAPFSWGRHTLSGGQSFPHPLA